jgi:hypothetical protein
MSTASLDEKLFRNIEREKKERKRKAKYQARERE